MGKKTSVLLGFTLSLACAGLAGCEHTAAPPAEPISVSVSQAIDRQVTDYEYFLGRTDAVNYVDVRARVNGYLEKVFFKPGMEVKKGDVLFQIDPRPYKAALDKAEGQIALNEASLRRAEADVARNRPLVKSGAVSQQEFDKLVADRDEAKAAVVAARANAESDRLNLDFTRITAPIDGRISRELVTAGNLVVADKTLLTTIVSVDPIYAYMDLDERTMLHIQKLIREGKVKSARETDYPVALKLPNESDFVHAGLISFVNNQVDLNTGTLQIRATFNNPSVNGNRVLSPGLSVRIRVPVGPPYNAVLVSEKAVGTDQGKPVVFVVNDKNEVVRREVTLGSRQEGLRVIESGVQAAEWVVVSGLQRIRPGLVVKPHEVPMPNVSPPTQAKDPAPGKEEKAGPAKVGKS